MDGQQPGRVIPSRRKAVAQVRFSHPQEEPGYPRGRDPSEVAAAIRSPGSMEAVRDAAAAVAVVAAGVMVVAPIRETARRRVVPVQVVPSRAAGHEVAIARASPELLLLRRRPDLAMEQVLAVTAQAF